MDSNRTGDGSDVPVKTVRPTTSPRYTPRPSRNSLEIEVRRWVVKDSSSSVGVVTRGGERENGTPSVFLSNIRCYDPRPTTLP